jgi:Flp pilus assembly pilin Flp
MIRYFVRRAAGAVMDRKGVSAAEYAVLAVGIVVLVGGAVTLFKDDFNAVFTTIGTKLEAASKL